MVKNYLRLLVAVLFATNVMAQNVPSYVPKDGLVGWWPFNGNANDESGNGNNGTVNGATLTADRNGKTNSAYSFDGTSNKIEIQSNKLFDFQKFTIHTWIQSPNNKIQKIISRTNWNSSNENFSLWNNQSSTGISVKKNSNCSPGKGWNHFSSNFNNAYTNKWSNLICTYNGQKLIFFLDGKKIDSMNMIAPLDICENSNIRFGAWWSSDPSWFKGQLDDIAIYNRALSNQEVKQLYEGCTKETAISSSFNSVVYTSNSALNLSATPSGGTFNGEAVTNNAFEPSKAKLGKNQVKYNFKNSTGCADSTNFTMILVDTLGNKCSTYDTLKIKVQLTTGVKAGQQTSMNVYPNPASELLIIEANDIQALSGYRYKIVDLQGKEVYNALTTSSRTEISLKSIGAKGMYILQIVDEKGVSIENKKIVLE